MKHIALLLATSASLTHAYNASGTNGQRLRNNAFMNAPQQIFPSAPMQQQSASQSPNKNALYSTFQNVASAQECRMIEMKRSSIYRKYQRRSSSLFSSMSPHENKRNRKSNTRLYNSRRRKENLALLVQMASMLEETAAEKSSQSNLFHTPKLEEEQQNKKQTSLEKIKSVFEKRANRISKDALVNTQKIETEEMMAKRSSIENIKYVFENKATKQELDKEFKMRSSTPKNNVPIGTESGPELRRRQIIIESYNSPDQGEQAFAMLLDLNMVELHLNPGDKYYDNSQDDDFAPTGKWI